MCVTLTFSFYLHVSGIEHIATGEPTRMLKNEIKIFYKNFFKGRFSCHLFKHWLNVYGIFMWSVRMLAHLPPWSLQYLQSLITMLDLSDCLIIHCSSVFSFFLSVFLILCNKPFEENKPHFALTGMFLDSDFRNL